jgi:hypothetical protein
MSKYIEKIEKDYNDGKISKEEATKLKLDYQKNWGGDDTGDTPPPPSGQYTPIGRMGLGAGETVFKDGDYWEWDAEYGTWILYGSGDDIEELENEHKGINPKKNNTKQMEESIIYQSVIELYNDKSFESLSHNESIRHLINKKPGFFGPKENVYYKLDLNRLKDNINRWILHDNESPNHKVADVDDLIQNVILFTTRNGLIVTKYGFVIVSSFHSFDNFPFEKPFRSYNNYYLCEFSTLCFPKSIGETRKISKLVVSKKESWEKQHEFPSGPRRYFTTLSGKQNTRIWSGESSKIEFNYAPVGDMNGSSYTKIIKLINTNQLVIDEVESSIEVEDMARLRIDDDKIDSEIYPSRKSRAIILNLKEVEFFIELDKLVKKKRKILIESEKSNEKLRVSTVNKSIEGLVNELDKDGNGEIDVIEGNDFNLLLKKHQKSILEINRDYIQQFVKVSTYLKTKKTNIQSIFDSIKDITDEELLSEYVEILKENIHSYNLLLYHSLNMIISLVEDDMISFYEIYEAFDNLNMFDSKWERDVSQELSNIGDGLKSLMIEVRAMGEKISAGLSELTYATEQTNVILDNRLTEIDSSIQANTLITLINTYQSYKVNKNTKSLR